MMETSSTLQTQFAQATPTHSVEDSQQQITETSQTSTEETTLPDLLCLQTTASREDIVNIDLQKLPLNKCTSEQSRHARIFLLITGVLTEIMQELMKYSGISSKTLYEWIVADKHFNTKLSTEEWQRVKTLYDPLKMYRELDISLMYKLIKNFKMCISRPTRNWGSKPQRDEIGDDVERIRRARNDYLHDISTKVTEQTLTEFFDVFIDVGKRVDLHMKIPTESSYEQKIQNFKTCYLDDRITNEALESSRIVESEKAWFVVPAAGNSNTIYVYRSKGLTKYINERKKLPDNEKTPLLCIFPDIKDDDAKTKARILNEYRDEINAGLISVKFEKAYVGCIILSLEVENTIIHHNLEQELSMLISKVMKYLKIDTVMVYMVVTMAEGWHINDVDDEVYLNEENNERNSLVLNIDVDNSILQTSDVFEENMQHFFEVISTKTNGKPLIESNDSSAIIIPIQKGI